jgi:hypothetical protein
MPGDGFVTSGQWKNARRLTLGRRTKIMSHDTDTIRSAAADAAAAPLTSCSLMSPSACCAG